MNMEANPILVEKYRAKTLESFHRGAICLINANGEIIFSAGNPHQIVFPRSSLKFTQQIQLIHSGAAQKFNLTDTEIAITCGSHNGEAKHLEAVRSILKKCGLTEEALQCGSQPPTLREDRAYLYENGLKPLPIHNNCSGKHAGFLALSVFLNEDPSTYIDPNHPVQKKIKETISSFHDFPEEKMDCGLDGCSAPIVSMPLYNLATGIKNLLTVQDNNPYAKSCRKIAEVVSHHPFYIAGNKRYCTDLMRELKGKVIAKTGAEGIFTLACPKQGWYGAIKIDDGSMGPQYAVAQEIIRKSKVAGSEALQVLEHYRKYPVKNWAKRTTGTTHVHESVLESLKL